MQGRSRLSSATGLGPGGIRRWQDIVQHTGALMWPMQSPGPGLIANSSILGQPVSTLMCWLPSCQLPGSASHGEVDECPERQELVIAGTHSPAGLHMLDEMENKNKQIWTRNFPMLPNYISCNVFLLCGNIFSTSTIQCRADISLREIKRNILEIAGREMPAIRVRSITGVSFHE